MSGTAQQAIRRVPSIKFRYVKSPTTASSSSSSASQVQSELANKEATLFFASDVPASPRNTAVGGKASLQPRRTPVSEKEIEAILCYYKNHQFLERIEGWSNLVMVLTDEDIVNCELHCRHN